MRDDDTIIEKFMKGELIYEVTFDRETNQSIIIARDIDTLFQVNNGTLCAYYNKIGGYTPPMIKLYKDNLLLVKGLFPATLIVTGNMKRDIDNYNKSIIDLLKIKRVIRRDKIIDI